MPKAQVYAHHKYARISPKKVGTVMDLVRGSNVHEAKVVLTFDPTKAAKMLLKVVNSALANAIHNLNLSEKDLFLSDVQVGTAPTFKRGRAGSRGRPSPILKRNSHITVGLSERNKE